MISHIIACVYVCVDNHGGDVASHQDTPVATVKEDSYIVFNVDVHIQKTLDALPPGSYMCKILPLIEP